jgi:hypothetical protein
VESTRVNYETALREGSDLDSHDVIFYLCSDRAGESVLIIAENLCGRNLERALVRDLTEACIAHRKSKVEDLSCGGPVTEVVCHISSYGFCQFFAGSDVRAGGSPAPRHPGAPSPGATTRYLTR